MLRQLAFSFNGTVKEFGRLMIMIIPRNDEQKGTEKFTSAGTLSKHRI
jgi:hypothetical protein